jgi:hypothetical protein
VLGLHIVNIRCSLDRGLCCEDGAVQPLRWVLPKTYDARTYGSMYPKNLVLETVVHGPCYRQPRRKFRDKVFVKSREGMRHCLRLAQSIIPVPCTRHASQLFLRITQWPSSLICTDQIPPLLMTMGSMSTMTLRTYSTSSRLPTVMYDRNNFSICAWANINGPIKPVGAHLVRCDWDPNVQRIIGIT